MNFQTNARWRKSSPLNSPRNNLLHQPPPPQFGIGQLIQPHLVRVHSLIPFVGPRDDRIGSTSATNCLMLIQRRDADAAHLNRKRSIKPNHVVLNRLHERPLPRLRCFTHTSSFASGHSCSGGGGPRPRSTSRSSWASVSWARATLRRDWRY